MPEDNKGESFNDNQSEPNSTSTPQPFYDADGRINNPEIAHDIANSGQLAAQEAYASAIQQEESIQKALYETEQSMTPEEAENYEVIQKLHAKFPNACQVWVGTEEHPTTIFFSLANGGFQTDRINSVNAPENETSDESAMREFKNGLKGIQFPPDSPMVDMLNSIFAGETMVFDKNGIRSHNSEGTRNFGNRVLLGLTGQEIKEFNQVLTLVEAAALHRQEIQRQEESKKVNSVNDLENLLG